MWAEHKASLDSVLKQIEVFGNSPPDASKIIESIKNNIRKKITQKHSDFLHARGKEASVLKETR